MRIGMLCVLSKGNRMIQSKDSREWAHITYRLQTTWKPLMDSPSKYDTVKVVFNGNGRVLYNQCASQGLVIEVFGASNDAILEKPEDQIHLSYSYRVSHTVVIDGGPRGVQEILEQLWGTVVSVLFGDARASDCLECFVTDVQKVPVIKD